MDYMSYTLALFNLNLNRKIFIFILSVLLYLTSIVFLVPYMGRSIFMFGFLPSILSALLFGSEIGVGLSVFVMILGGIFYYSFGHFEVTFFPSFTIGIGLTSISAWITGRLKDLQTMLIFEKEKSIKIENDMIKKSKELEKHSILLEHEIKERVKTEKILGNSEKKYKSLVEKAKIAMMEDDVDGNITYYNNRLATIFGYRPEEIKNKSLNDFIYPEDIDEIFQYHKNRMENKTTPARYEFRGIKKDGSIIYCEVDVSVLIKFGMPIGTRSYIWDISDRKKVEFKAQENDKRFKGIFENATLGIYRMQPDGTILMANPALIDLWLLQNESDAVGCKFSDIYSPAYEHKDFMELLEREGMIVGLESEWTRQNNTRIFIRETAWAVKDESNKNILYYEGIAEDISESKLAQAEKERLSQQLSSAKSEIKYLSGLLPICSNCKKIRDDSGYWRQLEEFIDENSDASFSHGICPECATEFYKDYIQE